MFIFIVRTRIQFLLSKHEDRFGEDV